jgi:hydrogenase-4 component B
METVLIAIAIILLSGILSLTLRRYPAAASVAGVGGIVTGCLVGLIPTIISLYSGQIDSIKWNWTVPGGSFSVGIDPLSALFLLLIFGISVPVSIYGASYLWRSRGNHDLGVAWFFTSVLIAAMAIVVIARNSVLFLVAWEVMSLSSLFLVLSENKKSEVQAAGWIYIVAAHLGTAFLFVFFILLGKGGSLEFDQFAPSAYPGLLFILSVIGFGTKAGFVPLHVWLPEAHPAAPSHISALMSGVMIKMGIYGILRTLIFLGSPAEWWGWLLLGIGLTSGVLGVLFAITQHDLKRLLAYHSVENIGIISIGLGIGVLGISYQEPMIAILGFGGGLLHVVNHSLFKGLLFLGAGSVVHSTGTREIDKLGGLMKKMPWTGAVFLIGSIAICGLPPLNGFISEFLIYLGALQTGSAFHSRMAVASLVTIIGLSLIGGLALACFTKAFGIVFLGEPRTAHAIDVHDAGIAMIISMAILAAGCMAIGLLAPFAFGMLAPVIAQVSQISSGTTGELLVQGTSTLYKVIIAFSICCGLIVLIALFRLGLLRGKKAEQTVTWDCGYALPTSRMQYTASSFAQPLLDLFRMLLGTRRKHLQIEGVFPKAVTLHTATPDIFQRLLFRPIFIGIQNGLDAFRWLQHGNVHLYILYILITLLTLMFWKLQ